VKKSQLLFITDVIALTCFVFLVSTGVIIRYLLPPGSGRWGDLWHLNRHDWGSVHFLLAMVFLGVIATHLGMHWRWIKTSVAGKPGSCCPRRIYYGLAALLGLILLAAAPILDFYW